MNPDKTKPVACWLAIVCVLIVVLIAFGGYVRLSRSGLSMVEWHVITGAVPPISETQWAVEFEKYKQSPEYQKINRNMSLDQYKTIYYNEYTHRMLGRIAGLVFVIPLLIFLIRRTIHWKRAGIYYFIGLLFALQGFMGWYMVQSGLVDRPSVSHYRLTIHLLLALLLLCLCFWRMLHLWKPVTVIQGHGRKRLTSLLWFLFAALGLQTAYGAMMAGLKAGHVSNTFPLMMGSLIPMDQISAMSPGIINIFENPMAIHFVHRWLGVLILVYVLAIAAYAWLKQKSSVKYVSGIGVLTLLQLFLGIALVLMHVPLVFASAHQLLATFLLLVVLFSIQRHGSAGS